ncbi:MAG: family 10 glycosylhydrolase, partial [Phycisphaerae bacterium]
NMDVPEPQQTYMIEVDYPDDSLRTFCIGLMERKMMDYPPAGGVDSGGEFSLSHKMQTQRFFHWPRGTEQRVLFFNAQNRRRAAASKIRLYRVEGPLPALNVPATGGRSFGFWLEEGDRWATFQGAPTKNLEGYLLSMNRWAEAAAYMGANTLSPTLAIYQNVLYPSKCFDGYFRIIGGERDPMTIDLTRMLLLVCEKHEMRFQPDFHPTWNGYKRLKVDDGPYVAGPRPMPHLMVSKDGEVGDGPFRAYFNPIYPANMEWLLQMAGEFADRYKDSPALDGVQLRIMAWVWESRNGWPSLNWGYDDYTVNLFAKETHTEIPVKADDPQRFHMRYEWLMENAKTQWMQWRCEKITDLYRRVGERVRQARPDLTVYSTIHGGTMDLAYISDLDWSRNAERLGLRAGYAECGYDVDALSKLQGVRLINGNHYYGRRQRNEISEQTSRDALLNPAWVGVFRGPTGLVSHLMGNSYFEANDVVKPGKFGLEGVKPQGFVGVVNPAGRHYLERYALVLAENDESLILDGGEGYLLGQDQYLHEFLAEYRPLPAQRFTARPDARDPVAVWELKEAQKFWFYAVNRERYPMEVRITLQGTPSVTRLGTGKDTALADGVLKL